MAVGILKRAFLLLGCVIASGPLWGQTQMTTYGEVIEHELLLLHPDLTSLSISVRDPESNQSRTLESHAAGIDPSSTKASCSQAITLLDTPGERIGEARLSFAPAVDKSECAAKSEQLAKELQEIIPSSKTLFDPFIVALKPDDVLAQRLTIETLKSHPDMLVLAFHVTAPGDTVNRVVGINQPKFLGRPSDDVDHEVARTGKMIVQVIPSTHRMETHMPLRAKDGSLVGTIVTVYLWHNESEAPERIAASMKIRDQLQSRIPSLEALLKP